MPDTNDEDEEMERKRIIESMRRMKLREKKALERKLARELQVCEEEDSDDGDYDDDNKQINESRGGTCTIKVPLAIPEEDGKYDGEIR